ncbi:MAG: MFS transporter [Phycisphaerae bacterium]|jgi:MFS family permease|nr:MFS transporter [Phycisphaerae bacterium]
MFWRRKSYDILPALSIRGPELRRSMRLVTSAWMMGVVWMFAVSGSRLNLFGRMLGFNDFHFGMLTALTFLATFAQLAATILVERSGLKKHQFLVCGLISRFLWIVIATIPLIFPLPSQWAVWSMLTLVLISSLMLSLATPAWHTWMGDLIPRRIRGRYFATRNAFTLLVKIPSVIFLGLLLDSVTRAHPDGSSAPVISAAIQPTLLWFICGVFFVAGLLGMADILVFFRIREVIGTTPDTPRVPAVDIRIDPGGSDAVFARLSHAVRYLRAVFRQLLLEPLADPVFRRYVAYSATTTFALTVAGQYFWRTLLENYRFGQLGSDMLFVVMGPLASLASLRLVGRLLDKWGRRPVLLLGTSLIIFSITPYFFATRYTPAPQFVLDSANYIASAIGGVFGYGDFVWFTPKSPVGPWLVMLIAIIIGGIGWTAIMLAQNNIILSFADSHGRSKYVAAHAVLISMGGVLGGVVGGVTAYITRGLQTNPIVFGPVDEAGNHTVFMWNNWHVTFALSFGARIVALLLLINMTDPGARPARDMLRHARHNIYNIFGVLLFPLRSLGRSKPDRDNRNQ